MEKKSVLRGRAFKNILLGVFIVGFIMSSFYTSLNLFSINQNTINLKEDSSVLEVLSIGIDDSVVLENGEVVKGGDVESYIKVNKGTGTWYVEEDGLLAVEVSFSELSGMLVLSLIYLLVLVGLAVWWIIKSNKRKFLKVLAFLGVGISIGYYFIVFEYLEKVLNISI